MGSRIFSDGRNPEDGSSLAVTRRLARQMRRRRDRLLKRKARLEKALIRLGFWPQEELARKALVNLDPYALRRDGLDKPLSPAQFGRALFHLNQRRGFRSNRRTNKKDSESGLLKSAIRKLRQELDAQEMRTVGEWLAKRHERRESVRARLRGKTVKEKAYDLYIDRAMIAEEFDKLWFAQASFDPLFYTDIKRAELRDTLLHQRPLRPMRPGRCTLIPEEERAPLALPSTQRFRICQELNHLRLLNPSHQETPLSLEQRDMLATLLERSERSEVIFAKMHKALKLSNSTTFNLQDAKRDGLKTNSTTKVLSSDACFGAAWHAFSLDKQDEIVDRILGEASESVLVDWLVDRTGADCDKAEHIASIGLAEGYGNLSRAALGRVLPNLFGDVITYADAVKLGGFDSHSLLSRAEMTGEILTELPYYGEALQRHVGFADPHAKPDDPPEKRFGRIANPTVHIGLNELRKVVNSLVGRYGHPSEVVVEVARELKQGFEQRKKVHEEQAARQKQNQIYRESIQSLPGREGRSVSMDDLQRMRLWTELNSGDAANRRCPYTGKQIGITMLFSDEVEIDHILPFSMTLDDSLNNKTVALRRANRDKGNQTPHDAFGHSPNGYDYEAILARAASMPNQKRKRFAVDGYQQWLRDDKDFLARALNDTAYFSRIAKEYLSLICPPNRVRVIPGRLTAMLRAKFRLNDVLSLAGEKNRDDHRHHAVDAAVIGVTDQGLLQRFAKASADARGRQLDRLVESMPLPWPTYHEHVARAVSNITVSHKPDHGHEGGLHNETAYGFRADGQVVHRVILDSFKSVADIENKNFPNEALRQWLLERTAGLAGKEFSTRLEALQRDTGMRRVKVLEKLQTIGVIDASTTRHRRIDEHGEALAYKGYKGNSNYCMEIFRSETGNWKGTIISKFEAHQNARLHGIENLRNPKLAQNGKPLVMRLMKNDLVRLIVNGKLKTMRITTLSANGQVFMTEHHEANVDARNRDEASDFKYLSKIPGSFHSAQARRITVSPIGEVNDPGFRP